MEEACRVLLRSRLGAAASAMVIGSRETRATGGATAAGAARSLSPTAANVCTTCASRCPLEDAGARSLMAPFSVRAAGCGGGRFGMVVRRQWRATINSDCGFCGGEALGLFYAGLPIEGG
jgi:hypothetical protein